ncbi:MAG: CoA-binding protein [Bacteroidota bacterium]
MIIPDTELKTVLQQSQTIALVGCSPDPYRTSNYIANFLMEREYRVIPVNPREKNILGQVCYPSLNDIPGDIKIDLVNVFRRSEHTADIVNEVLEAFPVHPPYIWTQLDVSSTQAEQLVEKHQLKYIKNRCIMVEWERRMLA